MISRITGTLLTRELDRVEVMTPGGVAYECIIPLSVFEALPHEGEQVSLHTHLAVRDDAWLLYGFGSAYERAVFQRLITAKGVGPALAIGILSSLSADRVVRALQERDIPTLMRVPRVGRKKAEQIVLDLADKIGTVGGSGGDGSESDTAALRSSVGTDAIRALVSLGYPQNDAERALKTAMNRMAEEKGRGGGTGTPAGTTPDIVADVALLVRSALAVLTAR